MALLASVLASAVGLVRFAANRHQALVERFVSFLEESLKRQEAVNARFQGALEDLTQNVRRSSQLLTKVAKRLDIAPDERRDA